MSTHAFSAWFFTQPGWVQELVVAGPPFVVMAAICLILGQRFRVIALAWFVNPLLAPAAAVLFAQKDEEERNDWAREARASVDEAVIARRRGLPTIADDDGR